VPDFLPFRGTRYRDLPDASRVVAPPYDVIDEEDRSRLEAIDPHNAVRLILPRADPPTDPYEHAANLLQAWLTAGILAPDPEPAFYGYRMHFTDAADQPRHTVGVIGALVLPSGDGDVFGHERTLPKARSDRLALLRATRTNLDPIWGLSLAADLNAVLDTEAPPTTSATTHGGITRSITSCSASTSETSLASRSPLRNAGSPAGASRSSRFHTDTRRSARTRNAASWPTSRSA